MKALFAGIVLSFAAFSANAGGYYPDCRRGVDHKHPSCYAPAPVYNNPHHNRYYQDNHRHHHNHYYQPQYQQPYYYTPQPIIIERGRRDWVAPLIGGVILGTVISEANRNYYYGY